jgi:acylglycerol lipase
MGLWWGAGGAYVSCFGLILAACASHPQIQDLPGRPAQVRLEADALVMDDGVRLPLTVWPAEAPRAVLVAVHGFNGYANDFSLPGPWFAARGVSVYAYDQRGFGRHEAQRGLWPGSDRLARDLVAAVALVAERHGGPGSCARLLDGRRGCAQGGNARPRCRRPGARRPGGVGLAGHEPALSHGPVGCGPHRCRRRPRREGPWRAGFRQHRVAARLRPRPAQHPRHPLRCAVRARRPDAAGPGRRPRRALPALFVYGARDEIIPEAPTQRVMAAMAETSASSIYDRGWHMVLHDMQRERVWQDILTWMTDPSAVLPSGEEVVIRDRRRLRRPPAPARPPARRRCLAPRPRVPPRGVQHLDLDLAMPACTRLIAWAAPCDRSMMRPPVNGPRSLIRTTTDCPLPDW